MKRTAPTLSTKKKVAIMSRMIVVKLATMTSWVVVTCDHQGAVSCTGEGGGGGQVSLMQTRQSVLCDPMLYSNSGSRPRWPPASPPRRACLGVGMKGDSPSGSENGRLEIEPKGLLPLLLPMLLLTTLPLLLFLAAPPLLLLLLASLLEGPRGLTGVLSAVRMGMVVS